MKSNIVYMLIMLGAFTCIFNLVRSHTKEEGDLSVSQKVSVPQTIFLTGKAKDISLDIVKRSSNADGMEFESWYFQEPLLPTARLLNFRKFGSRFWFSGDSGLVSFDPVGEKWHLLTKKQGMPGDTVYGIELNKNKLLVEVFNWGDDRSLSNVGRFNFLEGKFNATKMTEVGAKAQGINFPDTQKFSRRPSDVLILEDRVWFSYRGTQNKGENKFVDGGVALRVGENQMVEEFTVDDGLASAYCNSLAATSDGSVWVSHWNEESGLSHYLEAEERWQVIVESVNGIELGGVSVHNQENYLFIAQQRGLVIYDTESAYALLIEEKDGLPSYIVADVQFDLSNTIWASAYSYGRDGQSVTGLSKIGYESVQKYFDKKRDN